MAKVPEPCIRTASYEPLATFPNSSKRLRIFRTTSRNSMSREPKSRSMACLTVSLVESGPGVKRSFCFSIRDESPQTRKVAPADRVPPGAASNPTTRW